MIGVHKLLSDQIEGLQLPGFTVLRDEIRNSIGSEFVFFGLAGQTAATIKSFEGADVCWVEEAQALSRRSLQILLPTIRKAGSEIWFSFNPELDTDAVYQRFVLQPSQDAAVVKIGYADNPWFPPELEIWEAWQSCREALHCRYEDLLVNYEAQLQPLLKFLELDAKAPEIDAVLNRYHPEFSRGTDQHGLHYRKGKIGRYREVFTAEQQEILNVTFEPFLIEMGYPF